MRSNQDTVSMLDILNQKYGIVKPFLNFDTAFHFLIAVILSAQTTDKVVNSVTPSLFKRYPDAFSLAEAETAEVESMLIKVNFYKNKAKFLVEMSKVLNNDFEGEVPASLEKLVKLPGVGRKVANVVLSEYYGLTEGIVVDTHVSRVAFRIGWTDYKDPKIIEQDLILQWPKKYWIEGSKHLILIGRQFCFAVKKPECENCPLRKFCEKRY